MSDDQTAAAGDEPTTDLDSDDTAAAESAAADPETKPATKRARVTAEAAPKTKTDGKDALDRQLSISLRGLLVGLLVVALAVTAVVFIVRDVSARSDLDAMRTEVDDRTTAEEIAGRYAVNAATLDYEDLTPWIAAVKDGVSPELERKYDVIAAAIDQVLVPVRMQTSASLVLATTTEVVGDLFRVDAVVEVNTKSVQMPNGGTTVTVYSLTLNRADDWQITEVGDPVSAISTNLGAAADAPPAVEPTESEAADSDEAPAPTPGG